MSKDAGKPMDYSEPIRRFLLFSRLSPLVAVFVAAMLIAVAREGVGAQTAAAAQPTRASKSDSKSTSKSKTEVLDPELAALLSAAASYLDRFEARFSNVVSEEDYLQEIMPGQAGSYSGRSTVQQRRLRSDFTLVQAPGTTAWLPFRDVFEVDGKPVRDRSDRLTELFLTSNSDRMAGAARIMNESARYNIGNIDRTINVPVMAFEVVRRVNQPRFQFTREKPDPKVDARATAVRFREIRAPSFIRGPNGTDLLSEGRLWIEPETGAVLRTFLAVDALGARAEITTRFRTDDTFGVAIPVEMDERYTRPRNADVIGTAKYSKFRKFGVDVTSGVKEQ